MVCLTQKHSQCIFKKHTNCNTSSIQHLPLIFAFILEPYQLPEAWLTLAVVFQLGRHEAEHGTKCSSTWKQISTTSDRSKVGGGAGFRRISPHCKFSCQSLLLMICSVLLNTVTPLKHPQRRNASCRGNSDSLTVRGLCLLSNTVSFVPVIFPSLIFT